MANKQNASISKIIAHDLPKMRVVKGKAGQKAPVATSDAKMPVASILADSGGADDDVTMVVVEPKAKLSRDSRAMGRQVVLVSKSKKKVVAMQG